MNYDQVEVEAEKRQQSDAANVSFTEGTLTIEDEVRMLDLYLRNSLMLEQPNNSFGVPIEPDSTHFLVSAQMMCVNWHIVEALLKHSSVGGSQFMVHVPWQSVEEFIEKTNYYITKATMEIATKRYLAGCSTQYPNLHIQDAEEAAEMQRAFHDSVFKNLSGTVQLWRTIADAVSNKRNVIVIGSFLEKRLLQECGMHKITWWTPCTLSDYLLNEAHQGSLSVEDKDKVDHPCLSGEPMEEQSTEDGFVVLFNPDVCHLIISSGMVALYWHVVEIFLNCGSIERSRPMVHMPWQAVEELNEMRSLADPGTVSDQTIEEYLADQVRLYPNLHLQNAEEAAKMQREFHGDFFKTESGVVHLWRVISDAISRTDNVAVVASREERKIIQECDLHKIICFSPDRLLGHLMRRAQKVLESEPSSGNCAAEMVQERKAPTSVETQIKDLLAEPQLSGYCTLM